VAMGMLLSACGDDSIGTKYVGSWKAFRMTCNNVDVVSNGISSTLTALAAR